MFKKLILAGLLFVAGAWCLTGVAPPHFKFPSAKAQIGPYFSVQGPIVSCVKGLNYVTTTSSVASATTVTFTGVSLGAAACQKQVIVAVVGNASSRTTSSVTIATVSATKAIELQTSNRTVAIWSALIPSSTTSGDVVITWSAAQDATQIGVWYATAMTSVTTVGTGSTTSNNTNVGVTTVAGGFAVGVAASDGNPPSYTWGGLTGQYQATLNGRTGAGASTTGTSAGTTNFSGSNTSGGASSWGYAYSAW